MRPSSRAKQADSAMAFPMADAPIQTVLPAYQRWTAWAASPLSGCAARTRRDVVAAAPRINSTAHSAHMLHTPATTIHFSIFWSSRRNRPAPRYACISANDAF
jgi:hypothetical protein